MKKKAIPALIAVALVAAGGIGYYAGQQQSKPVVNDVEQISKAESNLVDTSGNEKNSTTNDAADNNVQEETPKVEITEEMKLAKFEEVYNQFIDRDELGELRLAHEMSAIEDFFRSCGHVGDSVYTYSFEYRAWRDSYHYDGWEDTNETVYATNVVNVRSEPSTDSEKLGQLAKGQSVTRISINEETGWSKVELTDGSEVYVSSAYLSTQKPVVNISVGNTIGGNTGNTVSGNTSGNIGQNQAKIDEELGDFVIKSADSKVSDASGGSSISYEDYDPNWNIGG